MTPHQRLLQLLPKEHVSLGGLSETERGLALALVWAGLPDGQVWTEPAVNQALKARLAAAARFIGVDHVELRRWLVDLQWLQRDDYGREYRKVPQSALREALRPLADVVAGTDWDAQAQQLREGRAQARAERRAAWERGQAAAA
ncbi:MAG: DUF2087 domain-containing protein [Aquabacterium sp.]